MFSLFVFEIVCLLRFKNLTFDNSVKFLNVKHVDCNPGYMIVFTATPYNVLLLRNKCLNFTVFIVLIGVTHVLINLCTDTSASIPLAGLSVGTYYVSVASVDTANRTGHYSDVVSVELNGGCSHLCTLYRVGGYFERI